jgi:restriction system protein
VAKRQGIWAELQRERARQARQRQQQLREFQRAEARSFRDAAKAERERQRLAAGDERERKKLYVEHRKAEAAAMAEDVRARVAGLGGLLKAGIRDRPVVTFASLRRTDTYPAFDAGPLGRPAPPPLWEHFAPEAPSGLGKVFGGAGRFERQLDSARARYTQAVERYQATEAARQQHLAAQRATYDGDAAAFGRAQCRSRPVPAGLPGRGPGGGRKVLHPRPGLVRISRGIPVPDTHRIPARPEGSRH